MTNTDLIFAGHFELFDKQAERGQEPLGRLWLDDVPDAPFDGQAVTVETLSQCDFTWNLMALTPNREACEVGDWIEVALWVRALEPRAGEDFAACVVEFERAPLLPIEAPRDWTHYQACGRVDQAIDAGEKRLVLQVGFEPQIIQFGHVAMRKISPEQAPAALTRSSSGYRGREPDASWRSEATQRIEQHRRGPLAVHVTDGHGRPIAGADVRADMQRHAFGFGSAISVKCLEETEGAEDGQRYRETFLRLFNMAVIENALKWPQWDKDRQRALRALDWLAENGIPCRGHCLMWPTFNHFPKSVQALREDPEALRRRLADHVTDEASDCRGKVVDWDVINEHVIYREIIDMLGDDEAVRWFRLAREADPEAKLYINEYDVVGNCGHRRHHLDAYERIIRFLLEAGAPVDGIGLQGHFLHFLTPPRNLWRTLDRFGKFGLELAVTEMDITVSNGDEQLHADYLRDFVTACFAHPAMSKLLHWGFWEAAHWRPFTALFGRDWTPRPAAKVWEELVREQWWTSASGRTDRDGQWQCPAFYGAYDVAVEMDGRTENRRVAHSAGGDPVTIELPGTAGDAQ